MNDYIYDAGGEMQSLNLPVKGLRALSLIDYPKKTSMVIFVGGCNFVCPYCHNMQLVTDTSLENVDLDDILSELKRRKKLLDAVVLTGGEPTLYPDIIPFAKEIKKLGYLTKLDSNGYRPDVLEQFVKEDIADLISMDIKSAFTKERYSNAAGVDVNIDLVLQSVDFLINSSVDYEFRTTLIEGFVNYEDLVSVAKRIKGAKIYYLQKANESLKEFKGLPTSEIEKALKKLKELNINVFLR